MAAAPDMPARHAMTGSVRVPWWRRAEHLLPLLLLAVLLAVAHQMWRSEQRSARQDLQTDFDFRVRETDGRIMQRMKAYEQILRGTYGLFAAGPVNHDEFRAYVDSLYLEENYPGAQGLGFAPIVRQPQKDLHIAAMRAEGFTKYAIRPDGEREIYAPVAYREPFVGTGLLAHGHDMYADPVLRTAMEQARDSGSAYITGKVLLPQEEGEDTRVQAGFIMYLPVYLSGALHDTVAERRASIIGWVYAPFRMIDLMTGILGEAVTEIDIEIHDGNELTDGTMMYDPDFSGADGNPNAKFRSVSHLMVANHPWTVATRSLYGFEVRENREKPHFVAYAGVGASVLLSLLAWLLLYGRARALQSAREMGRREAHVKTLNEQLALTFNELQAIMEAIPELIYVINTRGELIKWNSTLEKFCGLAPEQMMHRLAAEFVCEEDRPIVIKGMAEVFEKGSASVEARFIRHDGVLVPFLCNGSVFRNPDGEVIGFTGAGRDISSLLEREKAMRLAESVFNTVEEGVVVTDPYNNIIAVNPAFTAITGYTADEVIGKNPRIMSSGRHSKEFYRDLWETLLATGSWHGEIWDRRKSGEIYIKWLSIRLVRDEAGAITHHVAVFYDISERKEAEERMQRLAHYDALTDLPNRTLFADRLRQALVQAKRDNAHFALMFLDLDKFKPINDSFGHVVGDLLLKEVARRLLGCVRESDTVSRIGGDEFVVLLHAIETERDATRVAEKILHAIGQPFSLAGHDLHLSASIGIAVYPEHGSDGKTLTRNADIAMYYAKGEGRNNAKFYQPGMMEDGS
jgi:diguanylate cyclase (GGDEF)-like protein/PAS domain S-box-containing protein